MGWDSGSPSGSAGSLGARAKAGAEASYGSGLSLEFPPSVALCMPQARHMHGPYSVSALARRLLTGCGTTLEDGLVPTL